MLVDTDTRLSVPARLAPWVADARLPRAATGRPTIRIPDAATSLVFRTGTDGRSDLVVIGPQTRAGYFAGTDVPTCVRLRLRPARSRPLLGVPPAELVDRGAPLTDFWGPAATTLARRLAGSGGDPVRILAALADALLDRLPGGSALARSDLTAGAARVVDGGAPLTAVAQRVGVSERHLRNLFAAEVGVSPKHYARIDRLRRVLAGAGERGWAELARATGYYDQAHLSADFGAMMGVPPGAFLDGRLPAPSRCD